MNDEGTAFLKEKNNVLQQTTVYAQRWEMTAFGISPHIFLHIVSVVGFVCPLTSLFSPRTVSCLRTTTWQ